DFHVTGVQTCALPIFLEISTFASWDAFSSWYHHLIRKQFESSPEIRDKVRELVSGISDDLEKIRAIYHFVVTEVRYNAWEFGVRSEERRVGESDDLRV